MNKFTVEVYRHISPVKSLVDTFTADLDLESVAKQCLVYSRESNGSYINADKNVFFIVKDNNGISYIYGTPHKSTIKWSEVYNWG